MSFFSRTCNIKCITFSRENQLLTATSCIMRGETLTGTVSGPQVRWPFDQNIWFESKQGRFLLEDRTDRLKIIYFKNIWSVYQGHRDFDPQVTATTFLRKTFMIKTSMAYVDIGAEKDAAGHREPRLIALVLVAKRSNHSWLMVIG